MPTVVIGTGHDGPALTVSQILKNPRIVPELIRQATNEQFIADQLLRNAGETSGGAVQFWESGPLYPEEDVEVVTHSGQIPLTPLGIGEPKSAPVVPRGLGLLIKRQMEKRNDIGAVMRGVTMIRNAMVRSVDGAFLKALRDSTLNTRTATAAWSLGTATVRKDIAQARKQITDQKTDFEPNALVIGHGSAADLLVSDEIQKPYAGNVAGQAPILRGNLGSKFWDMDLYVTHQLQAGEAFVLQRNMVGGYSDEFPLEVSGPFALDAEGVQGKRWNVFRSTVGFIDQPKAATRITGV